MKSFELEIVTPEGVAYKGEAVQLSVRAVGGSMSVLAGHIPLVTALKDGDCRVYKNEGAPMEAECSGGILSVTKECVRLLCTYFAFKQKGQPRERAALIFYQSKITAISCMIVSKTLRIIRKIFPSVT